MLAGPLRVTVHIDRGLGLSTEKLLPPGSTVAALKALLADDDPMGQLSPASLILSSPGGHGPLSDGEVLTDGLAELEVCVEPSEALDSPAARSSARPLRIWAVSDIHSDMKDNMAWVKNVGGRRESFSEDCLIVAGDIANKLEVVRETLVAFKAAFRYVFFVPGNHDLWCKVGKGATGDSLDQLRAISALCDEIGVLTKPTELPSTVPGGKPVLVVPILSWHHPGFDDEPDIDPSWEGIPKVEQCLSDYHMCRWPAGLTQADGSVARHFDEENGSLWAGSPVEQGRLADGARERYAAVISFSHFLPRIELCPEKRFLTYPSLLKAVGSTRLGERVARLRPHAHVFGHTHFGWDAELDGVRYLQAPLSYPSERKQRSFTVALDDWCPAAEKLDEGAQEPFLVWTGSANGVEGSLAEKRRGGAWANFYEYYGRRPKEVQFMPNYVAVQYQWKGPGDAPVGWAGQAPAAAFVDDAELLEPYVENIEKELNKEDLAKLGGDFKVLTARELKGRIGEAADGKGPPVWVFDTRPPSDFERGHIRGAMSVPVDNLMRLALTQPRSRRFAILERLTDSTALKVICDGQGGEENLKATRILRRIVSARTAKFLRLRGGLPEWRRGGLMESTGRDDGLPPSEGF